MPVKSSNTQIQHLEQALRDSEERYKELIDSVTDYVYTVEIKDSQAVRTIHGPGCVKVTGYTAQDYDANPNLWIRMVDRRDRKAVIAQATRARVGGDIAPIEHRIVHKNGTTRWVRNTPVPRYNEQGKLIAYDGLISDITAYKQAEEARLHQSEAEGRAQAAENARHILEKEVTERKRIEATLQQRAIQLSIINEVGRQIAEVLEIDAILDKAACLIQERFGYHHVGLFTLDHRRNELVMRAKAGAYVRFLPSGHRLKLGQGMVGWVGQHAVKMLTNDTSSASHYVNLFPEVIPTKSELSVPLRVSNQILGVLDVQSPEVNAFHESDILVLETLADQIAIAIENARLYQTIQEELDERKRMEQQIMQSERLAAMGNLAATLAHEIKNPLQAIQSYLELVMDFTLDMGERDEYLNLCFQEVGRLIQITERVLNLARSSENTKSEPVAIQSLVERALTLVKQPLEKARILVKKTIPTELPLVQVVPDQIIQVLLNILVNATEAISNGGTIEIDTFLDDTTVAICISDDGPSIPHEYIERLFEPYFTTKPGSTGLGLYVCHHILAQQGGNIKVANTGADRGVAFTVRLPVALKPAGETG
jgi:PAS domain S-box-containing protein